jgi:hypothetical protein
MRIVEFPNQWLSRPDMAKVLGVSERTVTRRVDAGSLVRRTTPHSGNLYAVVSHETEQDVSHSGRTIASDRRAGHIGQEARRDETDSVLESINTQLADLLARIVELENVNADLTARLASIEHAHDMHVKVGALLVKRSKRLARLR